MNIAAEKKNIVQWIQGIDDEKTIEKILSFKEENEISIFENRLIKKGLNDVSLGNVSSHEEVKKRFEAKFAKK
jgi:predicted transcriptional regulator